MRSKFLLVLIAVSMFVVFGGTASAVTFFSDSFSYLDGPLVPQGAWEINSGVPPVVEVVSEAAQLVAPGSEDVAHLTGGEVITTGDKWYYSAVVTINDTRNDSSANISQDYFMSLGQSGIFHFRALMGVTSASVADPNTHFRFFIAARSSSGAVPWGSDLLWGGTYKVVVEWDEQALAGGATLWVDPVDINSTSVSDLEPGSQGGALNLVVMRQDSSSAAGGGNYTASVDGVAVGNDWTDVWMDAMNGSNIPEPASMALALLGLVGLGCARRRI